jgi:hypothetical protein
VQKYNEQEAWKPEVAARTHAQSTDQQERSLGDFAKRILSTWSGFAKPEAG